MNTNFPISPLGGSQESYWDTSTKRMVFPNVLKQHFVVAESNVAWTVDTCVLRVFDESTQQHSNLEVFLALDLGDGRIVAHCSFERVSSFDVTQALVPALEAVRATRAPDHVLIIHSDRGSVFASAAYLNLMVLYDFVVLSHSPGGSPTHNSPSERINRTLLRRDRFWLALGQPDPKALRFNDMTLCKDAVTNMVYQYNTYFKNERSLG